MKTTLSLLAFTSLIAIASPSFAWQATDAKASDSTDAKAEKSDDADDDPQPTLGIGSDAPSLDISDWVSLGNFEEVTEFKNGHVYIVEFWATWCPPCIASMPHISELQEKYEDQNVQVISVSNEDVETVEKFLKRKVKGDDTRTYGELTANYRLTTDPDGSVNKEYMKAAMEGGIPTAFIVGKTGKVEWIGHPMKIDKPLEQIVADKWDLEAAKEERKVAVVEKVAAAKLRTQMTSISRLVQKKDYKAVMQLIDRFIEKAEPSEKNRFQTIKFRVIASEGLDGLDDAFKTLEDAAKTPESQDQLARIIATLKSSKSEFGDEMIAKARELSDKAVAADSDAFKLDTQARLAYLQGDLDEAIEIETEALEQAPAQAKRIMRTFLEKLQEEKNPPADDEDDDSEKTEK